MPITTDDGIRVDDVLAVRPCDAGFILEVETDEGLVAYALLTHEQVVQIVRAEEAHDAAGEAWQAGAYPSGVTDPAETSGPRGMP